MKEQPRIGHYQALFLIISILFSGLIPLYTTGNQLGRLQWLNLILPLIAGILFYYFYSWLAKCLQGQTLDAMYYTLFGKLSHKLALGYFLLFYLFLAAYFMVAGISLWANLNMPQTPLLILIALTLLTCLIISRLGLEVIARLSMLVIIVFLALSILDTAFLIPAMRFERLLPLTMPHTQSWLHASSTMLVLLFAPLPLVLHFLPLVKGPNRVKRSLKIGLWLALAYLIIITFRSILLFGDTLIFTAYAPLKSLRLLAWSNGVSRLELLSLAASLGIVFLAGSYMLFICSKLLNGISGLKNSYCHYLLAIVLGFLMYTFSNNNINAIVMIGFGGLSAILLLVISALKQKSGCKF